MRTGQHPHRSVVFATRIEMNAYCNHPLKNGSRRLDMKDASLRGPRTKAGDLPPFCHRDGEILMPRDLPVRRRRLVKEKRADREASAAENDSGYIANGGITRDLCN